MAEAEAEKTPLETLEDYANGVIILSQQQFAQLIVDAVKEAQAPPTRRTESTSSSGESSSATRPARSL